MKYCPVKDKLMINTSEAQYAYFLLRMALKNLRKVAGLPLDKYQKTGFLTEHDSAAIAIIEAGNSIGIDFGVTPHNHNNLDLRDL